MLLITSKQTLKLWIGVSIDQSFLSITQKSSLIIHQTQLFYIIFITLIYRFFNDPDLIFLIEPRFFFVLFNTSTFQNIWISGKATQLLWGTAYYVMRSTLCLALDICCDRHKRCLWQGSRRSLLLSFSLSGFTQIALGSTVDCD